MQEYFRSGGGADIVVVGAGIVGAACAYYLARAGASVCVLEREFPAAGTSRACDGLILFSDKASSAELELARASARLWMELAETLETKFDYSRAGTIVLYESEEGLADGSARAAGLRAAGIRVESVSGPELQRLEPSVAPDLAGGLFYPEEAQVDSRWATLAFLGAAQRNGAQVHQGVEVMGLRQAPSGRVAEVRTREGDIAAAAVVLAAGVWSGRIARTVEIELPIRPRKGHILVTAKRPGLLRHPLIEGSYAASVQTSSGGVQVALVAETTGAGNLLLGSSREFASLDRAVSAAVMGSIAARALRFLPELAPVGILRSYAGLRPWSPDHLPLIGPVAAVPGLWLATGHEGAGIGLAPVTGQILADWLIGGQSPSCATAIRPDRFAFVGAGPAPVRIQKSRREG